MKTFQLVLNVLFAVSIQAFTGISGPPGAWLDEPGTRFDTPDSASKSPGSAGQGGLQRCGGFAGAPCDDPDEFCKLPVGQCCCDFEGVCTPIPQTCPDVYDPVCGCDGQTYGNECEADAAGVSIDHRGPCAQACGGFAGSPCDDPDEFCKLPVGQCCCDFEGVCTSIPQACPAVCDPVCGCDGTTYGNPCEADAAGVSVDHAGPCHEGRGLITGVRFGSPRSMFWLPHSEAQSYNVYRKVLVTPPPTDAGECYLSGIVQPQAPVPENPTSGIVWLFQVTGQFPNGEGPMGVSSDCTERHPSAACGTMQGLCESTGGVWDPLSCGHYRCGQRPACAAIIPGCNCGPQSNFVPGAGCVTDPTCG